MRKVPKCACVRAHFLHSIAFLTVEINSSEKNPKIHPSSAILGKKCRYARKCAQVPKSECRRSLFALNHIFDDGNEFPIKNYPKMTPITIHLRKKV